jgi:hypothetical protein
LEAVPAALQQRLRPRSVALVAQQLQQQSRLPSVVSRSVVLRRPRPRRHPPQHSASARPPQLHLQLHLLQLQALDLEPALRW